MLIGSKNLHWKQLTTFPNCIATVAVGWHSCAFHPSIVQTIIFFIDIEFVTVCDKFEILNVNFKNFSRYYYYIFLDVEKISSRSFDYFHFELTNEASS